MGTTGLERTHEPLQALIGRIDWDPVDAEHDGRRRQAVAAEQCSGPGSAGGGKDRDFSGPPRRTADAADPSLGAGRLLILNYQLLDADGNNCLRQGLDPRPAPPWFSIRQDGREIDSGNFEYG